MKKKMYLTIAGIILLTGTKTIAQDWSTAGNTVGAPALFGTIDQQRIDFITNNVTRGRLTNGGLWGFGNTSPLAQVHINSKNATRNPLQIDVLDSAKMIVTNIGKVGIGTSVPDSRLQINSDVGEDALKIPTRLLAL